MKRASRITCPLCRAAYWIRIREGIRQTSLVCPSCLRCLQPTTQECCIFCAYGDTGCDLSQARDAQSTVTDLDTSPSTSPEAMQ